MARFHDIQMTLDRILGNSSAGNHGAFWRGKTRDEFVSQVVFGLPIIEVGDPTRSNLVLALRGEVPFGLDVNSQPGAAIRRMPAGRPPASAADIDLIAEWIATGCPDDAGLAVVALGPVTTVDDDVHVKYWREIDLFFLPSLASVETRQHVGRLHAPAYVAWKGTNIDGGHPDTWKNYRVQAKVQQSFEYIRLHQRRILTEYYGDAQDSVFDSLWKFGGDLLPRDPQSGAFPEHRMNGVSDWFYWIPYIEMSLLAGDKTDLDIALARGWQVGIAADGLIRKDPERPRRMPISEFNEADPSVREAVVSLYVAMQADALIEGMVKRAKAFL